MINPMPYAQQSLGMVTSTVDKVRDYSKNLKNGVGQAVFNVGNKVLDGGQSFVHGLFNAAEAIPNMVFDLKRNSMNAIAGLLNIPSNQQSSNPNDSSQQAQQKLLPNNYFNNPQQSPQYMQPFEQRQQLQQQFQLQPQSSQLQPQYFGNQLYTGQYFMEGIPLIGQTPFNPNTQPMVRNGP